jgi:acyl transferase domain-containing protein
LKSNIGHAQAAAGVAGVTKMLMAMRHGIVPATLHAQEASPHVDWDSGAVQLVTEAVAWPETGAPRRAGVSSFGVSGTNAHVILEQAPIDESAPPAEEADLLSGPRRAASGGVLPFVVSARGERALVGQAARLVEFVGAEPEVALGDVAWSLATRRARFDHRAVVLAGDRDALLAGMEALAAGRAAPGVFTGVARSGRVGFVFGGQGSQRLGMGRDLCERFPVFAEAFAAACDVLDAHLDRPLREVLFAEAGTVEADLIDQTLFAQAGLFAFETAMVRLLGSWGIGPDVVMGHSLGEIVAAHVAGVLNLSDAVALVAARGRLMQALPAGGAMLAVELGEVDALELIDRLALSQAVSLAAINGPSAVVFSGQESAVEQIQAEAAARDVRWRRPRVSHAFHSALMEPMLAEFASVVQGLQFHAPLIPMVSNLTGESARSAVQQADYWVEHVREAVRFFTGVHALLGHGVTQLVEISGDGSLTAMISGCLPENDGPQVVLVPAARAGQSGAESVLAAAATLHVAGVELDWPVLTGAGNWVPDLPTYAFQHRRYWFEGQDCAEVDGAEPSERLFAHLAMR